MKDAKRVLQDMRGRDDVSGEMALLLEGLNVGGETSIEEYIIDPANDILDNQEEHAVDKDSIKLYGTAEEGQSWIARPVRGHTSTLSIQSTSMVTLFGSIHEKILFGSESMFNTAEQRIKHKEWDEESLGRNGDHDDHSSNASSSGDESVRSPLLSRQGTNSNMGIGGGWQLAYREDEKSVKRIYLHEEGGPGSRNGSVLGVIHAADLVSQSVLRRDNIASQVYTDKVSRWTELFEPGVKHALFVGIGIQILQQGRYKD